MRIIAEKFKYPGSNEKAGEQRALLLFHYYYVSTNIDDIILNVFGSVFGFTVYALSKKMLCKKVEV